MRQFLIFGIFMCIYQRKKITARELAEKFEISQRSIYRYIDALSYAGIPVYTKHGKNGGIFINKDFRMDGFMFSEKEKDVLKQLLISAKKDDTNPLIDALLEKL